MLQALRRRLEQDEEGFTLIELMVVVLIIAILLAIAIPTFLGARTKAQDRAAQSNLRNALTAEKTFYVDNQTYTATQASMTAIEPSLTYNASLPGAAVQGAVSLTVDAVAGETGICIGTKSASGTVFALVDEATGPKPGTYYFGSPGNPAASTLTACTDALMNVGGAKF